MRITVTFVQPLAGGDTPTMNWRTEEWDNELALMKRCGIDTIILIMQRLKRWMAYDSEFLKREEGCFPVYFDYMDMFLTLCEKHDLTMYVPLHSPWHDWLLATYDPQKEYDLYRQLVDEIWERYGHRKAFKGWYFSQEISGADGAPVVKVWQKLAPYCRSISNNLPIMVSPYMRGIFALHPSVDYAKRKLYAQPPEQFRKEWDMIMDMMDGYIDIIAFQDGHVDFHEMPEYFRINVELAEKHHLQCWSNVESFSRSAAMFLHPLSWEELQYKMIAAQEAGHSKLITYIWMPYISPNGPFLQTRGLFKRYCEWFGIDA